MSILISQLVIPALGTIRVNTLTRADVVNLHETVSKTTPIRANRMLAVLRHMLNLAATEWDMRNGVNPASGIRRNSEVSRNRFLDASELGRLMIALGSAANQQSANIIRLALLTGARRGELLNATWDQFNLTTGIWTKPAGMVKQNRRHTIPLNQPALTLLLEMKEAADGKPSNGLPLVHLFPGHLNPKVAQHDLKRSWATICKAAELSDLRFHDIRHRFASFLASSGHNLPLIGQLLGHSQSSTTQRYAHLLMDPQREATGKVGDIYSGAGKPR